MQKAYSGCYSAKVSLPKRTPKQIAKSPAIPFVSFNCGYKCIYLSYTGQQFLKD